MKTTFITLCAILLTGSLVKIFVDEKKYIHYVQLLSGVFVIIALMNSISGNDYFTEGFNLSQDTVVYENSVIEESENRLAELISDHIENKFGIKTDVAVDLKLFDDMITVDKVRLSVSENPAVSEYLSDLLSIDSGMINYER